jgi:ribonuclease D
MAYLQFLKFCLCFWNCCGADQNSCLNLTNLESLASDIWTTNKIITVYFIMSDSVSVLFELIERPEDFLDAIARLKGFRRLAVDFEGEWNLHRYGLHLCLIQVCDGTNTFLIDPLAVGDLRPLLDIMEDPDIEIISHGPQSDIVLLNFLYGSTPKNIFDTEKAAQLLNYENTSLSQLLEKHFGFSKDMKVRVSDWNKRPLTSEMLSYAAKDVAYLHRLQDILTAELEEKGRLHWQMEECKGLEDIRFREKENPHMEIQHANKLSEREAYILKHIYEFRDRIAQELDKPAYYIIPNSRLLDLSQNPPRNAGEWCALKGVNPRLKKYAQELTDAVQKASTEPLPKPDPQEARNYDGLSRNAFFRLVDQRTQLLGAIRDQIKEEYDIYPMILSMRNLKKVAYGEATIDDFKDWQKQILLEKASQMELDLSILRS